MGIESQKTNLDRLRLPYESLESAYRRVAAAHFNEHVWIDPVGQQFTVGLRLIATKYGRAFTAEIVAGGVRFQGRDYKTLRKAATASIKSIGKGKVRTPSGRTFWNVVVSDDRKITIDEYLRSSP